MNKLAEHTILRKYHFRANKIVLCIRCQRLLYFVLFILHPCVLFPLSKIASLVLQRNPEVLLSTIFPYSNELFDLQTHVLPNIPKNLNPDLLFRLEATHPILIKYSDNRWKQICNTKFRNKKLLDDECYKEMYYRCLQEDEDKLANFTNRMLRRVCVDSVPKLCRRCVDVEPI